MAFEWRKSESVWSSGDNLYVNDIRVGSCFYDAMRSKGDPNDWKIETRLPGFRIKKDAYDDREKAKAALEAFTRRWIERISKP